MSETIVIAYIKLKYNHHQTGKTRHFVQGSLMDMPAALKIVQFKGNEGYYLYYLDQFDREINDTYLDSLEEALEQAEMEYEVNPKEWSFATNK